MNERMRAAGRRRRKAAIMANPVPAARVVETSSLSPLSSTDEALTVRRLAVALELLKHGVFEWDVQSGQVVYASPVVPAGQSFPFFQATSADTWFDSTHHDDVEMTGSAVDRALRGDTDTFSIFYRRKYGDRLLYVRSTGKVVARNPEGRALRVIGTYADLSGPVAEERGRHAREARVRNARFRAALAELATGLSHELSQPLAALCSNAQAVARLLPPGSVVSEEAHHALSQSVLLAERAAEIVKALRRLIQGESSGDECLDLNGLVLEVSDLLRAEASRGDVVIEAAVTRRPVLVNADRTQVEQILVNLVQNGIEAIAQAHPPKRRVTLRVRPGRKTVRVEVKDTGPGVDPAIEGRIFEAYFTTKPHGTGLGLRLSRSFAEAHGGRLSYVPCAAGTGALFTLELPRGSAIPDPGPSSQVPEK